MPKRNVSELSSPGWAAANLVMKSFISQMQPTNLASHRRKPRRVDIRAMPVEPLSLVSSMVKIT